LIMRQEMRSVEKALFSEISTPKEWKVALGDTRLHG